MQTITVAGFVQDLDRADRKPLLRRVMDRFRAARLRSEMALIDPRLREDAGLASDSTSTWPQA